MVVESPSVMVELPPVMIVVWHTQGFSCTTTLVSGPQDVRRDGQSLLRGPQLQEARTLIEPLAALTRPRRFVAAAARLGHVSARVLDLDRHHAPADAGACIRDLDRPDGGLPLRARPDVGGDAVVHRPALFDQLAPAQQLLDGPGNGLAGLRVALRQGETADARRGPGEGRPARVARELPMPRLDEAQERGGGASL